MPKKNARKKPAKRKPAKKGRPPLKYDPEEIERLAAIGCTYEEMADFLGWGKSTVDRKVQNEPAFRDAYNKGRSVLKMSLRRMQLKAANKGSAAMLIFLGKNLLGQRDTPEPEAVEDEGHGYFLQVEGGTLFIPDGMSITEAYRLHVQGKRSKESK